MKKITAKFNSKCNETGKPIKKGEYMFYDYISRKAYHITTNKITEANHDYNMCNANEEAYFDNFCLSNNI
jgi:hypothetical protein